MRLNQTNITILSNGSLTIINNITTEQHETPVGMVTFRLPLSLMASGVVIGNSLVCALYCRYRRLRTITNTFVVSLAVSDCLVALVFVPCFLLQSYVQYIQLIVPYIIGYILFAYLFNFCGVTYDRYQAIVRPLSYHAKMTRSTVNRILIVVWTLPLVMTLVPATWENQSPEIKALARRINQGFLILLVTILAVTICLAYSKIFRETRRQVKWMFSTLASSAGRALQCSTSPVVERNMLIKASKGIGKNKNRKFSLNIAAEVKAAKVFAVLIITFSVCWLPLIIINIFEALGFASSVPSKLIEVSLFTLVGNSLIDPFIYSLYKSDFRRAFRRMCGYSRSGKEGEVTSNCSNSYNKESFRSTRPTTTSSVNTKGSTFEQPLNGTLSTETFL